MRPALMILSLFGLISISCSLLADELVDWEEFGLRVAKGFRVSLFSDADLANDIYAMTLDSQGRPVVTSKGWIKTLIDSNQDGKADRAVLFAPTQTGGMGLCFDGPDLYFAGDGGVWRFRDSNGDGQADGPGEKLFSAATREHGGHAIRKGPDGWFYFIGGNDTEFTAAAHVTTENSPVREPETGALLRFQPGTGQVEVFAHGFRNPYDFDFNFLGDIFTYDSDVERDYFLPWYTPTRVFHIAQGGHHGWRLPGWQRSWDLPYYYSDTVGLLWEVGRGSPTGLTSYRHDHFPSRYKDGLFVLDWTFGKIFFFPLRPDRATYRTKAELFLEPIGTQGFAPTSVVVTPGGSLLVSIGGRRTRGAIYRIEYEETKPSPGRISSRNRALEEALDHPQPLDAWARARWVPKAQEIGPQPFLTAVVNHNFSPAQRIRAIEIVTELFDGLETARAMVAARASSPMVRARVAWSLGRKPCDDVSTVLLPLARDNHPMVRRWVLEAFSTLGENASPQDLFQAVQANLPSLDNRLQQATARAATLLPPREWALLQRQFERGEHQPKLTLALAGLWRDESKSREQIEAIETAISVLENSLDSRLRLQAIRLVMLALGDWNIFRPSLELYSGYELAEPLPDERAGQRLIAGLLRQFPSGDMTLDMETSRLLSMLKAPSSDAEERLLSLLHEETSATLDFHYLTVLSRLEGALNPAHSPKVVQAILGLDRKLEGREQRIKQSWGLRLRELVEQLMTRDESLAAALVDSRSFGTVSHLSFVPSFDGEIRKRAAGRYRDIVSHDQTFPWSSALVELMGELPEEESIPLLREQWDNPLLREPIILQLSKAPDWRDRHKFLRGLRSRQLEVIHASVSALQNLPRDPRPANFEPILSALEHAFQFPRERVLRQNLVQLLNRQSGKRFNVVEDKSGVAELRPAYQALFAWFHEEHPGHALSSPGEEERVEEWDALLKTVDWSSGAVERGEVFFRQRACHDCHVGATAFGPDLKGATGRFSISDLFSKVLYPNRQITPAYQPTIFETGEGGTHMGLVVFESADGVILQTGPAQTIRLADGDIVARKPGEQSLMPSGLLEGATARDLADLYAFLKTL